MSLRAKKTAPARFGFLKQSYGFANIFVLLCQLEPELRFAGVDSYHYSAEKWSPENFIGRSRPIDP